MKRLSLLAFLLLGFAAHAQTITMNDAVNAGCIISATNPCPRAGLNLGQPSGSYPYYKNYLHFQNPGFEPLQYQQIYQFDVTSCSFCSPTEFQWNINNTQYAGYDSNQWAGATFTVIQGSYASGTSDPALGCTGHIQSSANVSGQGPEFTINSTTNQGSSGCAGTIGLAGQVIIVSTNTSMSNILPSTNGWPQGTYSTSGGATITAEDTDLCTGCGQQSVLWTVPSSSSASITLANTALNVPAEKTFVLNGNYTVSFMAKSVSGSTTPVTVTLTARNGNCSSGCTWTPTITTSWASYSHTFALTETASPQNVGNFGLSFADSGTATWEFDNIAFTDSSTNPTQYSDAFVNALKAWCQTTANTTGPGCTLRYGPSPDSETMANWVKPLMTHQPSCESAIGDCASISTGYFTDKTPIYDFLQLCAYVGATPVLIFPSTITTADMANLVDFLEDNTGATTYGAIRQSLGQTTAWVGQSGSPFGVIYLEYGNEQWNGSFIGQILTSHSTNPNNYYDMAVRMGVLLAAARSRQSAQSYSTAVTKWIANGLTGSTTDFKYLTAYVGGQLNYSGGTITPTQGTEDGVEFQRYYGVNIQTVSTTGCTTNNASCPLYGPTSAETYSDFTNTSSTSGYQQSMAAIQAITQCGPSHNATCLAATYEGGISPDGSGTSTSGPFTQAVSDSFTQTAGHLPADAIGYQLAILNGFAYSNEYQMLQYYIGAGGVNVHIWGSMLAVNGDCEVTNSVPGCPRPQMTAAMVANYCHIGQEVQTTGSGIPTWNLASNSNGVAAQNNIPYLVFDEYASGSKRCLLITNDDLVSSHTVTLAGTNVPTTVTQYQVAPSALTSTNDEPNLTAGVVTPLQIYPVLTTGVTPSSVPAHSVTAWAWTVGGSPTASAPTFSPTAGTYTGSQSVTTSTTTSACSSYLYTGTANPPTTAGSTITVSSSETIYSYVHNCPGYNDSSVSSAAYTINAPTVSGCQITGAQIAAGVAIACQ